MGSNQLAFPVYTLLVLALAVFPSISAEKYNVFYFGKNNAPEKNINVVVESMVYCQSCDLVGSEKLSYDNPINGATVSVFCNNKNNAVKYYKTFETKENGHLYAELKGFMISKNELELPINSCYVRLVSSPNVYCDFPTNVNYGHNGSRLRYENNTISGAHYQAEVYAAGPLAFSPARCTPPGTKP